MSEISNVKNKFKFGGVEFRLETDNPNDPNSLASAARLAELIESVSYVAEHGVFSGIPNFGSYTGVTTAESVYLGLCLIAKDIGTFNTITMNLMHNVIYGIKTKPPGSTTGKTYFINNKLRYVRDYDDDDHTLNITPQKGRPYYNAYGTTAYPVGWYVWNGSDFKPLSDISNTAQ